MKADDEALSRACDAFSRVAFDERVEVWGKKKGSATFEKIDKWFWRKAAVDILETMRPLQSGGTGGVVESDVEPYAVPPVEAVAYTDVVTDRRQVERIWPKDKSVLTSESKAD